MAVHRTPQELAVTLNQIALAVIKASVDWTQNVCREIANAEVKVTPYDTGKAKSNWVASLNAPRQVDRPPLAKGKAAEGPALGEIRSVIRAMRFNDTFYLVNSLGYVVFDLNQLGRSRQAAAGWFQRNFAKAVEFARRTPFRIAAGGKTFALPAGK